MYKPHSLCSGALQGPAGILHFSPLPPTRPLPTLVFPLRSLTLPSGKLLIILQISTPLFNSLCTCMGIRAESCFPSSILSLSEVWAPFLRLSSSSQQHLRIHLLSTYVTDMGANTVQCCKMQYPRECLGKFNTWIWEEVCLGSMGPSLLPDPWALLTKILTCSRGWSL